MNMQLMTHTLAALDKPKYDNRNISDKNEWIMDNMKQLFELYHLSLKNNWKFEAYLFMDKEHHEQAIKKFNEDFDEKHNGEFRDMANKERHDNMIANRDGEG